MTFDITTVGDQACVILTPKELDELGVQPGDRVVVQRADISTAVSETELQFEIAKQVMHDRREVLKRLAE